MSITQLLQRRTTECSDCGAIPGEYHDPGCDLELCPRCGWKLNMCDNDGCPGKRPGDIWPIPLDDRLVWTGDAPGVRECHEFGYLCTLNINGQLVIHENIVRLLLETEWSREHSRFVQTTLTRAFVELKARGILVSRGWERSRQQAISSLTLGGCPGAMMFDWKGLPQGLAYYTQRGHLRKQQGKDFAIHFGQIQHPTMGPSGLSDGAVGEAVCECLRNQGVEHRWDGDPIRPIRVMTRSIVIVEPS